VADAVAPTALVRAGTEALIGRSVLVTGASRGIGLAIVRAIAAEGGRVAMVARTVEALAAAAEEFGGRAFPCDVTSTAEVDRLEAAVRRDLGDVPDAIVHSAGAFTLAPLVATQPEDFDRQLSVNLRAPFLVTRAFLPGMLKRGSGHVVTVGSIAGRVALPGNAAYSASKYGLRGLHEVLVAEVRGTGIRATLIEPAATDTPLWDALDPDSRDDLPSRGEMLRPEDVARAVLFVLSQPHPIEISRLAIRAIG